MRRSAMLYPNIVALCLVLPILGCDGRIARAEADCSASRQLYTKVLAAMCLPWSEDRETALGDLVDAAKDKRFEEDVTGEEISEWAGEIGPAECLKAGYGNPGPKYRSSKQKLNHLLAEKAEARMRADPSVIETRKRLQSDISSDETCALAVGPAGDAK